MALGRDLLFFLGIFALIIQLSLAEELGIDSLIKIDHDVS